MKISAVIPLYNKASYIKRAIDSIINQTFPVIEIIVIDDGSIDHGSKIVEEKFGEKVKIIRQENRGQNDARNRGIQEANGDFVGFLDADDEWKPDFTNWIKVLVNNFPDCGIYATSAQVNKPNGDTVFPRLVNIPPEPWIGIIPNFFELFQAGYAFNASSAVIPQKVLKEVGGFPHGLRISGEVACWINIAMKYPIAFSPSRSVIYHQEPPNRLGSQLMTIRLRGMPYIQAILDAIDEDELSEDLKNEAQEFVAQKQIFVAIQNIMAGNPAYARKLLSTCSTTKKYKRDWLWWRFWASFPAGWTHQILKLKQKIIR